VQTENLVNGRSRGWSAAMGFLLIVLGVSAMILPMAATLIVVRLLGWVLIFAAIAQAVEAIQTRGESGTIPRVLLAVLYAVLGGMLLRRPVSGAIAATAIIATLFIVDGIIELGLAFRLRGSPRGRGWLFAGGFLSIALGVMIWRGFPLSAIWVIGLFVGIRLVFKGFELMMRHPSSPKARIHGPSDWGKRAA
jgi:uncharacterized membrane protein HdeD (DUF308 family)